MWIRDRERLEADVDGAALGYLRMLVAAAVIWDVAALAIAGRIGPRYVVPEFHFKYPFFGFVPRLPGMASYPFFVAVFLAALAVLVGWRTRAAARILCLLVVFWFLLDAANYSDHSYLLCVSTVLVAWLPTNRWLSSDRQMGREGRSHVPAWTLAMARLQIALVFFFSGVSQINRDWLRGAPQVEWASLSTAWGATQLAAHPELLLAGAWLSMFLDIGAAIALWNPRARRIVLPLLLLYLFADAVWFHAEPSPLFMAGLSLMFLDPTWPRKVIDWLSPLAGRVPGLALAWRGLAGIGGIVDRGFNWFDDTPVWGDAKPAGRGAPRPVPPPLKPGPKLTEKMKYAVALWLLLQLALPSWAWCLRRNPNWTEFGARFAWRGQRRDKQSDLALSFVQPRRELRWTIEPPEEFPISLTILTEGPEFAEKSLPEGALRDLVRGTPATLPSRMEGLGLSDAQADRLVRGFERIARLRLEPHQYAAMLQNPDLVRQYARHVSDVLKPLVDERVLVQADWKMSLNDRPWERVVSESTNFAGIATPWDLIPLFAPLRETLPEDKERILVASERQAERQRELDMALPSSGLKRPAEPSKAPAVSAAEEDWLQKNFPSHR